MTAYPISSSLTMVNAVDFGYPGSYLDRFPGASAKVAATIEHITPEGQVLTMTINEAEGKIETRTATTEEHALGQRIAAAHEGDGYVYIVQVFERDDQQVLDAYATIEAAQAAHPGAWRDDDFLGWVNGEGMDITLSITKHKVKV